ncbi:MAG: hypothetical protein WDO16_12440 [Bacteroidota bacterium]
MFALSISQYQALIVLINGNKPYIRTYIFVTAIVHQPRKSRPVSMMRKFLHSFFPALLCSGFAFSQSPAPKELPAKRTIQKVKIDGLINEPGMERCGPDD